MIHSVNEMKRYSTPSALAHPQIKQMLHCYTVGSRFCFLCYIFFFLHTLDLNSKLFIRVKDTKFSFICKNDSFPELN